MSSQLYWIPNTATLAAATKLLKHLESIGMDASTSSAEAAAKAMGINWDVFLEVLERAEFCIDSTRSIRPLQRDRIIKDATVLPTGAYYRGSYTACKWILAWAVARWTILGRGQEITSAIAAWSNHHLEEGLVS
jgi:hypothetical protein